MRRYILIRSFCLLVLFTASSMAAGFTADHHALAEFGSLPLSVIQQAQTQFRLFYGHTSHGSQIVTGLNLLYGENTAYNLPQMEEYGDDLGAGGDVTWVPITRSHLDQPGNTTNVVIWSWCGGVSDNTEEGINTYLTAMEQLELEYPNVKFIYMTGHLDGSGVAGNLYARNNQIRAWCAAHGKLLFDFADIESYDPSGGYYPDESDACNWCVEWCATHTCPTCGDCAHTECFNCYMKGKVFWWLLAKMTGWNETPCCVNVTGNVDGDPADVVDISDLSAMVDFLFSGGSLSGCYDENNVDGQGGIDISDLQKLIDFLFSASSLPNCP